MTKVVHCKIEKFDIYIGRPSQFGNPFKLEDYESREACLADYEAWILKQPKLLEDIKKLKGKTLGCWCKTKRNPNALCHGDIMARIADEVI